MFGDIHIEKNVDLKYMKQNPKNIFNTFQMLKIWPNDTDQKIVTIWSRVTGDRTNHHTVAFVKC